MKILLAAALLACLLVSTAVGTGFALRHSVSTCHVAGYAVTVPAGMTCAQIRYYGGQP